MRQHLDGATWRLEGWAVPDPSRHPLWPGSRGMRHIRTGSRPAPDRCPQEQGPRVFPDDRCSGWCPGLESWTSGDTCQASAEPRAQGLAPRTHRGFPLAQRMGVIENLKSNTGGHETQPSTHKF